MTPPDTSGSAFEEPPRRELSGIRCTYCAASTREDMVKAAFWGRQGLIAIEDIPARVCDACGEQFYDDHTAHKIEQIVSGLAPKPARQILVPVFSLGAQRTDKDVSSP